MNKDYYHLNLSVYQYYYLLLITNDSQVKFHFLFFLLHITNLHIGLHIAFGGYALKAKLAVRHHFFQPLRQK